MTVPEAKVLLAAYRAKDPPPATPELEEALALAEREPELASWLEQEAAFDADMAGHLETLEPPPGLKEELLGLAPVAEQITGEDKIIPMPTPWYKNTGIVSVAATILVLFGFAVVLFKPTELQAESSLEHFHRHVTHHYQRDDALHEAVEDLDQIREKLRELEHPVPGELPEKIDALLEVGYGTFTYQNFPVSCIIMEDGNLYHLYIIEHVLFKVEPERHTPQVMASESLAMMTWVDHGNVYVLILEGTVEELQGLL